MPDFTQYVPPGVYVEESLSTVVNVTGVRSAVVALVGPAVGYRTATESLSFTDEEPIPLGNLGIDILSVEVRSVGGSLFDVTDDYILTVSDGEDGTPETPDDVVSIEWVEEGDIEAGQTVYVSYNYTDPSYYEVQRYADFDNVQDAYGPALDIETGEIVSPLSFAAKIAYENGANQLVLVATPTVLDPSDFVTAYAKIAPLQDVSLVVPLPVEIDDVSSVVSGLINHTTQTFDDGNFRIGILGVERSVITDPADIASGASSSRVVLAWPNRLHYYHGYTNQTVEVAGYYLAAAYAGRLVSLQSQVPLTKKRVFGFSGFPASVAQTMSRANKDQWSQSGVTVTEINRQNQLVVRHGVTTATNNQQSREISLVRARDTLVTLIQETMDSSALVGSYITGDTVGRVKGIVGGVLERAVGTEVIVSYRELKARQLAGNPSVIEVKFQYMPAYPLNYIVVVFSINTETGQTAVLPQATGI